MQIIKQELQFEESLKQKKKGTNQDIDVKDMKNTDMLYLVGTMNSIKTQAEEIVFSEFIYV